MLLNDDEDDLLFGCSADLPESSEDDDDDDAPEHASSTSVDRRDSSDSEGDYVDGSHFLDADVSTASVAQQFVEEEGGEISTGEGSVAGGASVHVEQVRCGCSRECLGKVAREKVAANRLTMCELEKGEKEVLVLGIMNSGTFSEELTANKKKKEKNVIPVFL